MPVNFTVCLGWRWKSGRSTKVVYDKSHETKGFWYGPLHPLGGNRDGMEIRVIDLPGIYSLDASSPDERVTRDYLLARDANLIVNLVDAAIQARADEEAGLHIADYRYGHTHALAQQVIRHPGRAGRTLTDHIDRVVLSRAGKSVTPALSPMGIHEENWPATVGIFTGVLAKEVVVGTLNSVYSSLATDSSAGNGPQTLDLFGAFPCAATIGAIVREAGAPWAAFVAAWTTGVAYSTATLFYQIATYDRHPLATWAWVGALGLILVGAILGLRLWAERGHALGLQAAELKA